MSPQIQNELIEIIEKLTLEKILKEVNGSKYYSIIFDETPDIGKKEQMSIVARYHNGSGIEERFLGFFDCFKEAKDVESFSEGLTGKVLEEIVINSLTKMSLNLDNLVSNGTDMCSVMASTEKGAVEFVKKHCKNAVHSPCLNHIYNLTVSNTCALPSVNFVFKYIEEVFVFFR